MGYILQAFPIIYLNLGGELLYIIEQRLQAQEISEEKSVKVLNDLLRAMLNRQYLTDIFRQGRINSRSVLKELMEKIVHASIMRLSQDSLDKLYDLMAMSIKYQFVSAPEPQSMLAITMTHVESWMQLTEDPEILLQIQYAKDLLITNYAKLSPWAWMCIRHNLLNYLQPCKTRVTIFLSRGLQSQSGYFYSEHKRPLPDGIILPTLQGRCKPYNFECDQPAANLGSNMFNDMQRPTLFRMNGFASLERIISQPKANDQQPYLRMKNIVGPVPADQKDTQTLQLELESAVAPAATKDSPQLLTEETLLDLFDLANEQ